MSSVLRRHLRGTGLLPTLRKGCTSVSASPRIIQVRWSGFLFKTKAAGGNASLSWISLHADPGTAGAGRDESDRAAAEERIENPAGRRQFEKVLNYPMRRAIPEAALRQHGERKAPAESGRRRHAADAGFFKAQQIVYPLVPPRCRRMFGPEPFGVQRPAGLAEPVGNEPVDADPFVAVVAVSDHEPEIAAGSENAAPLAGELSRELSDVLFRGCPPASAHPIGRRSQDDRHRPCGDHRQRSTITDQKPSLVVLADVGNQSCARCQMIGVLE